MKSVRISPRRLKRYERAEELCRAIRFMVTRPGDVRWPVTAEEMPVFAALLTKWMDLADKTKYDKPKGWPK
ncbi:MAG: hypothetical protein ACLGXA_03330 [Acidobacteriota bacterium]